MLAALFDLATGLFRVTTEDVSSGVHVDVSDEGFMTVNFQTPEDFNGDPLNVRAVDVFEIEVFGGAGDDELSVFGLGSRTSFPNNLDNKILINGRGGKDTIRGSEFADRLIGGPGNDFISGGDIIGPGDTIMGGPNDDEILVFGNADQVNGGAGNDQLVQFSSFLDEPFGEASGKIVLTNTSIVATGNALHAVSYTFEDIESVTIDTEALVVGIATLVVDASQFSAGSFKFLGSGANDIVMGGTKDDVLIGGLGDDELMGGSGNDLLRGDGDDDLLDGGAGNDTVSYEESSAGVEVLLTTQEATGEGNDTLKDVENVIGSAFDDVFFGNENKNTLTGLKGNDRYFPNRGEDTIVEEVGGGINDRLFLFTSDTLFDAKITDSVVELLGFSEIERNAFSPRQIEEITVIGDELGNDFDGASVTSAKLILTGKGGDDTLVGGSQNDDLTGGLGEDVLIGGGGKDSLFGEGGADLFPDLTPNEETDAKIDLSVVLNPDKGGVNVGKSILFDFVAVNFGNDLALASQLESSVTGPLSISGQTSVPLKNDTVARRRLAASDEIGFGPVLVELEVFRPGASIDGQLKVTGVSPGVGTVKSEVIHSQSFTDPFKQNNVDDATVTVVDFGVRQQNGPQGGFQQQAVPGAGPAAISIAHPDTDEGTGLDKSKLLGLSRNGNPLITSDSGNFDAKVIKFGGFQNLFLGDPDQIDVGFGGLFGADADSFAPSISHDSRFVAFESNASNLVQNFLDANGAAQGDIYWRDLDTGENRLVSRRFDGTASASDALGLLGSESAVISPDGRFVAFTSFATDLIVDGLDNLFKQQVYIWDSQTDQVSLVSVSRDDDGSGQKVGNAESTRAVAFSTDNEFLFFQSVASDLAPGALDENDDPQSFVDGSDVYARNLETGETMLISRRDGLNETPNGFSTLEDISDDGRFTVFASLGTNVTALADGNSRFDLFLFDMQDDSVTPISRNAAGDATGDGVSRTADLTSDGRFVVFRSEASDLSSLDTNGGGFNGEDVFLYDVLNDTLAPISVNVAGTATSDGRSQNVTISDDGRYAAFRSTATDLIDGFVDGNRSFEMDVFVRDLSNGVTTLASTNADGTASANGGTSRLVLISSDGLTVFFESTATDLVSGLPDDNAGTDVFGSRAHRGLVFFTPNTPGEDTLVLRLNGDTLELFSTKANAVVASRLLNDTRYVGISGSRDGDETLVVDFASGGPFEIPNGVQFDGGVGGNDGLIVRNANSATTTYDALTNGGGFLTADDLSITYVGLEPILDDSTAVDRIFRVFADGDQQVRLTDNGDATDGLTTIDSSGSGGFEQVTFRETTGSLTIEAGVGDDIVTLNSIDPSFAANLTLRGLQGDDLLDSALSVAVNLEGGDGDDQLILSADNLDIGSSQPIILDGGDGQDLLQLAGQSQSLDLTQFAEGSLQSIETIDIIGSGANSLTVGFDPILALAESTGTIGIEHDEDDTVTYDAGWTAELPRIEEGQFLHLLTQADATIKVTNTRPFQNPLNRFDSNRDGITTALDALVVINSIGRLDTGELPTPSVIDTGKPFFYIDVNGDLSVTALDALQIINALGRANAESERVEETIHEPQFPLSEAIQIGVWNNEDEHDSDQEIYDQFVWWGQLHRIGAERSSK